MHIAWKSPSPMVHRVGSLVVDLLASSHSPFFLSQSFVPSLSFSLFLSSDYKTMVNPHQKFLFFPYLTPLTSSISTFHTALSFPCTYFLLFSLHFSILLLLSLFLILTCSLSTSTYHSLVSKSPSTLRSLFIYSILSILFNPSF